MAPSIACNFYYSNTNFSIVVFVGNNYAVIHVVFHFYVDISIFHGKAFLAKILLRDRNKIIRREIFCFFFKLVRDAEDADALRIGYVFAARSNEIVGGNIAGNFFMREIRLLLYPCYSSNRLRK